MAKVAAVVLRNGLNLFGVVRKAGDPITEDEYNSLDDTVRLALESIQDIRRVIPGGDTEHVGFGVKIKNLEAKLKEIESVVKSLKEVIENPVEQES